MAKDNFEPPAWLIIRLGDDLNWWVEATAEEQGPGRLTRGVLDPRQVAHLTQQCDAYRPYGFHPDQLGDSFCMYGTESELDEQRLRVARCDESIYNTSEQLFALPLTAGAGDGVYDDFLEAIAESHIRSLNSTHRYARACTEDEMYEELDALDTDRYFSADQLHVFEELSEILDWKPAEWDDADES